MLTHLYTRQSVPQLIDPAPSQAELEKIFRAADRAPDHGLLKPWRFLVIQNQAREKLGQIFLAAAQKNSQTPLTAEQTEKFLAMPHRAPMIIVASARLILEHKIPQIEQVLAAAAAVQNLLLAIHACGYAAMWRTGEMAYDVEVKKALGIELHDPLLGFIYVGTSLKAMPAKKILERPMNEFVSFWE